MFYIKRIFLSLLVIVLLPIIINGSSLENYESKSINAVNVENKKVYSKPKPKEKEREIFTASKTVLNAQQAYSEGIDSGMLQTDYWTKKLSDGSKVILDERGISSFNASVTEKVSTVVKMESYGDTISGSKVKEYINHYALPAVVMYNSSHQAIEKNFYNNLETNTNITAIKEQVNIRYGLTIKKTSVRSLPTDEGVFSNASSTNIDRFQETSSEIGEAVAILHESADKKWYFIQMYNYRGWVKEEDIAEASDKNEVFNYVSSNNFIVVTGNHVKTVSGIELNMGDKLPLSQKIEDDKYINVNFPDRDSNGMLKFKTDYISKESDVNTGYLPYTDENIIIQAFKLLGDKYDWGNKYDGRDCSSFVISVYSTFGFRLPRNTDEQEMSAGKAIKLSGSLEDREKVLDQLQVGAALYMNNHAMMYLGKVNGKYYMIHDFTGYKSSSGSYKEVNGVAVTPVDILLSSGVPYLDKCTTVIQLS